MKKKKKNRDGVCKDVKMITRPSVVKEHWKSGGAAKLIEYCLLGIHKAPSSIPRSV